MTFDNLTKFTFRAGFSPSRYDDLNSFGNGIYRIEQDYFSGVFGKQILPNQLVLRLVPDIPEKISEEILRYCA